MPDVVAVLRARHWSTLTRADIRTLHDALRLLTPSAFHFALPAYLTACADGVDDLNAAPDGVLPALTPKRSRLKVFLPRAALFSAAESAVIADHPEFAAEVERTEWSGRSPAVPVAPALARWRDRSSCRPPPKAIRKPHFAG